MSRCIKPVPISMTQPSGFVMPHFTGDMFTAAAASAITLALGNKFYFYQNFDYGVGDMVRDREVYAQAVASLAAEVIIPWLEQNMSKDMHTVMDPFMKGIAKPLVVGVLMLIPHKLMNTGGGKNAMQVVFGSGAAELVGAAAAPMTLNRIFGVTSHS